jgi:DNA-binding CsgD family transcriptional regulator
MSISNVDWTRVASDGGAGVMIVDADGRVLFMNSAAARVYAKRAARDVIGLKMSDLFPGLACAERMDISKAVIASGDPLILRDLWSGYALRSTIRRLDNYPGAPGPVAMWVVAHESALLEENLERTPGKVLEAKHIDLGPLTALTISELKVLALIGEGLSNADIAGRLHRAVKTVESHRAALTDKTGTASRVQLGIMARRAGLAQRLQIEDAVPVTAI